MKQLQSLSARSGVVLVLLLLTAGCGGRMGKVDGQVVWEGGAPAKELANGQVVFESSELKVNARGEIGPDGKFTLRTNKPDDGCPVGEYQVAILEHRPNAAGEGSGLVPAKMDEKYGDLKTSGLTATVKPGTNPITFTVKRAPK
jgi:hypothetical protein